MLLKIVNILINLPHKIRYKSYYKNKNYKIDENNFFRGEWSFVYGGGNLEIGKGSYCGSRFGLYIKDGYNCFIGENTSISHNVRIYTSNRRSDDIINNVDVRERSGDVFIGNNVWIGVNVLICEGVTIGDNSVIGANSVVSKDIPKNTVAVGAPIKIIKRANKSED